MEKYKVDYSELSHFKGIRILLDYIDEGLNYAQKNNIKEVCIWTNGDWEKKTVDFDFLQGKDFIEKLHLIIKLSKKSKTDGIYYLSNLKDLRCDFEIIDLSNFPKLEKLNIGFYPKVTGWESLKLLKELMIGGVKTDDLSFLSKTENLEYLRIIRGNFTSLKGIENLSNLKNIFLQNCSSLAEIKSTINQLPKLEQLHLESCKNLDLEEIKSLAVKTISVIQSGKLLFSRYA